MGFIFCIRNMAAPPTLNLLREIILIRRVVATRFVNIIPLALLRFLSAAYSLFLFAASQHGHISAILNPLLILSINFRYVLFLHLIPIVLFVLGPIFFFFLPFFFLGWFFKKKKKKKKKK